MSLLFKKAAQFLRNEKCHQTATKETKKVFKEEPDSTDAFMGCGNCHGSVHITNEVK
jgi:hypothetical protein